LRSAAGACACVGGVGGYFFNDKGSLGHYNVRVSDPVVDGRDVALYTTGRKRPDDNKGTAVNLTQGDELGWASPTGATQQTGKTFSALLTVTPYLAGSATMNGPISDDVTLSGSLTFTFAYGL